MALAVSQAVKIESASGTSVTTNNAITFASGALAIALVSPFQGTGSNCAASDSINGAYTMRTAQDVGNSAVRFGDKDAISSGLANLTADGGALCNGLVGIWHEVTGQAAVAFDTQQGTTGTSAAPDTVNVSNAQADSIYLAAVATLDGANPISPYTINASGSEGTWIEKDATNSRELNGATFPACGTVYQIVSSIAARSHTWTTLNTGWAAASVVYKMASSSAAPFVGQLAGSNAATGYRYPISARTSLDPLKLQLLGKDTMFGAPGQVLDYLWPLPQAYPIPISARTHLDPLKLQLLGKDQFFTTPGDAPSFSWPLPQPYLHPISARTWLQSPSLVAGKDQFFAAPGMGPQYSWPLPLTYPTPLSARTWLQSLNLLAGKDQFFGAPGMGPSSTWPLPLAYAFPMSARTWLVNLLETTLGVVAVPRQAFDAWPLQQGYAFPLSGRTWLGNLLETTLLGGGAVPAHLSAWPLPMAYAFPLSGRTWLVNLLESTLRAGPIAPRQSPRAARYQWSFHDSSVYR